MTPTLHSPPRAALLSDVAASTRRVRRWDTPPAWLAPGERARAAGIRDRTARDAWLTARLAAKRLIAARLPDPVTEPRADQLAGIDIRSRDAVGRGSRPRVFIAGREVAVALSIAHVAERVLVAVGPATRPLGVDLTPAAAFAKASSRWWLTAAERAEARLLDPTAAVSHAARLWSVKEAVYKAVLPDRPFDPRLIEVRLPPAATAGCTALGRQWPDLTITTWHSMNHAFALVQAAMVKRADAAVTAPTNDPTITIFTRGDAA
jgi:hypothetical protein